MDTTLPQKFPFILDRNLAKANCTGNRVCTFCDIVVLGAFLSFIYTPREVIKEKALSELPNGSVSKAFEYARILAGTTAFCLFASSLQVNCLAQATLAQSLPSYC